MLSAPRVSVVIPTRDRPEQLRHAVTSVVRSLPAGCTLIVVDQSRDDRSSVVVAELGCRDVRVMRTQARGASAARNCGASAADCELLLFTDDDCVVGPNWVRAWQRVFSEDLGIGVAFGAVTAPSYDKSAGWIPTFIPERAGPHVHGAELFLRGPASVGMGANMAVRSSVWSAVGGFDERLGAGVPFAGAEEIDLSFRIVRRGYALGHVTEAHVVHHLGFRPWAQASPQVLGYAKGQAAMYAKHLRCADMFAARLLLADGTRRALDAAANIVRGRRPIGLRQLQAYVGGLALSLAMPIDRNARVYTAAERDPASAHAASSVSRAAS